MLNRRGPAFLAVMLLAGLFLYGVMQLFALRYARGDVYPPYSSLRPDPVGAKAIHDALASLPGVEVQRNFRPLPRLAADEPVTLVYAGVSPFALWEPGEFEKLEQLVRAGSRVIFTFFPIDQPPDAYTLKRTETEEREKKARAEKKMSRQEKKEAAQRAMQELRKFPAVVKEWGVSFEWLPRPEEKGYIRRAAAPAGSALEPDISWHSALCFSDLSPAWTTHYTSSGRPVFIERALGGGSIVFAADSFFLSNEALRSERQPRLLGHLFAGPQRVIFDEHHLAVSESPGIVSLARKYGLHGAMGALALLCLLFIWKCSARFLPPRDEEGSRDGIVMGKEGAEGFVNLLRRSIAPSDILATCVEEWRKTSRQSAPERARLEEAWAAEQARPPRERNAVAAYRNLTRALTRRP